MGDLVQQYLDQILEAHPRCHRRRVGELHSRTGRRRSRRTSALSLSSSDGYVYECGDTATEFTIQSISKPFTYALALDQLGQQAVDAHIGVEPSGEAFNEISVDKTTRTPKNPMINAGRNRGGVAGSRRRAPTSDSR